MKSYPLILLLLLTFVARGQLKMTVTINKSDCGMNNGSIMVVASGGVPPYEYLISGDLVSTNGTFTSLTPGDYLVGTRDAARTLVSQRVLVTNTSIPPVGTITTTVPSSCDKLYGSMIVTCPEVRLPFNTVSTI